MLSLFKSPVRAFLKRINVRTLCVLFTLLGAFSIAVAAPHQRYALVVGVGANANPSNILFGANNDTSAIIKLLQGKYGFPTSNIHLLLNEDATRAKILAEWDWLIIQAKPGDTVVFYYSGHGVLIPKDTRDGKNGEPDGAICPFDALSRSQLIFGYEIGQRIDRLKTDKVTVIIDACHSGNSSRNIVSGRSRSVPASRFGVTGGTTRSAGDTTFSGDQTTRTHPERYIGAAQSDQKAHEDAFLSAPSDITGDDLLKQTTMGALTHYLVNELWADTTNSLTYADLVRRIRVPLREKYGAGADAEEPQVPQVKGPGVEDTRFLAEVIDEDTTKDGKAAIAQVEKVTASRVDIRALSATPLTPDSILTVTGTKEWVETRDVNPSTEKAMLRIQSVTGLTAVATLIQGSVSPGMSLFEIAHGQSEKKLRVALTGTAGEKLRPVLLKLPYVDVVSLKTGADITLDSATVGEVTPYRGGIKLPAIGPAAVPPLLNRLHAASLLVALKNTSSDGIHITLKADSAEGLLNAKLNNDVDYSITVDRDAYVTIIDVAADGAITGISSQEDDGRAMKVRAGTPWKFTATAKPPLGVDTLKIIATQEPLEADLPQNSEESRKPGFDSAAKARQIVAQITRLLNQGARNSVPVGPGTVVMNDTWGSTDLLVRIIEP